MAAKLGQRVLVIDADLGLANTEILLGVRPQHHVGDLLDGSRKLSEVLTPGPHGILLLSAGSGVRELAQLDPGQRRHLLDELDTIDQQFDLVLVDSGAGLGENVLFFVGAAQEAMLVVSPEPTSLADAYAAVKMLSLNAVTRCHVVVNPAPNEDEARAVFAKLSQVCARFLKAEISYLGCVPHDHNLRRAVMWQQPVVDLFPHSPASQAFRTIAHEMLSHPPPRSADGAIKFLWQRLLRESMETGS